MLLRRVSEHVRQQNWFAVLLDFFIVVVGVFVGLEVQDWNDDRKARSEERALLDRLRSDTAALLTTHDVVLDELRERGLVLVGVNPVLFSQAESRPTSARECRAIAGSHVYRRPPDELPVLDEMLETGRFDRLRDPRLRETLRSFLLFREQARAHYAEVTNELFRLHSRFPSLIVVTRMPRKGAGDRNWGGLSGDGFLWVPQCDIDGMRANHAFLNEYADNLGRIASLTRFVEDRREQLVELDRMLAASVGN